MNIGLTVRASSCNKEMTFVKQHKLSLALTKEKKDGFDIHLNTVL